MLKNNTMEELEKMEEETFISIQFSFPDECLGKFARVEMYKKLWDAFETGYVEILLANQLIF